jgi:acetyl-CoA carboxylase carboxyltransferase component
MGAEQAVNVIHRRRLAVVEDRGGQRQKLAAAYAAEHLTAQRAAELGLIDEIVAPAHTRDRLASALDLLDRASGPRPPAGNIPL